MSTEHTPGEDDLATPDTATPDPADQAADPVGAADSGGTVDDRSSDGFDDADPGDGEEVDEEPEEVREYQRFSCATEQLTEEALTAARTALDAGEVIVLPTDTVYGIGADAFNADAVERLLQAKGRGRDMPPPVLIADAALIRALAVEVPDAVHALVELHWPGPLTIICKAQPSLQMDLGDTAGTVALRVPDHEVARALLRRTGPMAVSSANLTGQDAALSVDEAIEQLGHSVAVYLDAGSTPGNVPSTIIDFTSEEYGVVVREGALPLSLLQDTVPELRDSADVEVEDEVDADDIAAEIDAAAAADPPAVDPHDSADDDTGGANR